MKELHAIEGRFDNFYDLGKTMAQTYVSQGMEAGNTLMKGDDKTPGFDRASEELLKVLTSFRNDLIEASKATTTTSRSAARSVQISILVGGALAAALAVTLVLLLSRSIAAQIDEAVPLADALAKGDLTTHFVVNGTNEIARLMKALQGMQINLKQVVSNVRQGSESVALASAEIAQGNQDLSNRTESQASALEETAASMDQLGSQVRHNAKCARQANELALSASSVAVQGGQVVAQVVETMKGINESSRKISEIISVIDSIAFQTNILALNAAVEAARAGEQGRGFAVVASEVRSLAGRSAGAAKEIKSLINASVERVEQGCTLVDKAGTTMNEIVSSIRHVTDIMGEITLASNEQNLGVSQVGEAVSEMDRTTQQNAALVEEMAAAASSLKSQAQELVQTVAVFELGANSAVAENYLAPIVSHHDRTVAHRRYTTSPVLDPPAADPNVFGINLDNAIKAHADWRTKLRNAASKNEYLDADTISRDDCCEMGKWLHGRGSMQFGRKSVFVDLIKGHNAFHQKAGDVARAVNMGKCNIDSLLGSGSPFNSASNEVTRLIVQLRRELGKPENAPKPLNTANPPKLTAKITSAGGDDEWETF